MAPQKNDHIIAIRLCVDAMRATFGEGYVVQSQSPITGVNNSEPEPDVTVIEGSSREADPKPKRPLVTIEVSDATLRFDRRTKAKLYAKAGIADYWILNLTSRCLEVHRQPDPADPHGARYTQVTTLQPGDTISPLARPEASIKVEDLLP